MTEESNFGLKYSRKTWIEARDRKNAKVLIGGLGGFGVGRMWFNEEPHHQKYDGYDDAPELECTPNYTFGAQTD